MEFIGKKYKLTNNNTGLCFIIQILKKEDDYSVMIEFSHPKDKQKVKFTSPVNIRSNKYVESLSIDVNEYLNNEGNIPTAWIFNGRRVDEFKINCKFKGSLISSVSTIEILHLGMNKWVSYPLSMVGNINDSETFLGHYVE